jgi:hypothetical protein
LARKRFHGNNDAASFTLDSAFGLRTRNRKTSTGSDSVEELGNGRRVLERVLR